MVGFHGMLWRVCVAALMVFSFAGFRVDAVMPQGDISTDDLVRYRARLPLSAAFRSADHDDITVYRVFPEQANAVKALHVHIRLAEITRPGQLAVEIGDEIRRISVNSDDWIVHAVFDTPEVLKEINLKDDTFAIRVSASEGIRVGRLDFDSSPRARWASKGEDGTHFLYAISYEILFETDDIKLREAGFLELPDLPRKRPVYDQASTEAESVEAFPDFVRSTINLNGTWELASSPPDRRPSVFNARVIVPGVWLAAEEIESLDSDVHSLWYRREFFIPPGDTGKVILHFQQVSFKTTVYVNGVMVGSHLGDLAPFSFDITDHVMRDRSNEIMVCVEDHTQHFTTGRQRSYLISSRIAGPNEHLQSFGMTGEPGKAYMAIPGDLTGETDAASKLILLEDGVPLGPSHCSLEDIVANGAGRYLHTMYRKDGKRRPVIYFSASDDTHPRTNGRRYDILAEVPVPPLLTQRLELLYPSDKLSRWTGILKDVELRIEPAITLDDVFVETSVRHKTLTVEATLSEASTVMAKVRHEVWKDGERVLTLPSVELEGSSHITTKAAWPDPRLWDIGDPYLYFLKSELIGADGTTLDVRWTRFGFREFWIAGTEFVLNGRPIRLQGDSPSIYHWVVPREHRWFESLRFQANRLLNHNFSRLHVGGLNSPAFVQSADETGMLVSLEPPYLPDTLIWDYEHDKPNSKRFEVIKQQYRDWARRFRNHPSLVMYSIENEFWSNPVHDKREIAHFTRQLNHIHKPLNDIVRKEDRTRPTTLEGARGAYYQNGVSWSPIVNIHYAFPPATWKQDFKRPVMVGEFSSEKVGWTHLYFNTMNVVEQGDSVARALYWGQTRSLRAKLASQIDELRALDVPGIMPYGLWRWSCPMPLDDPRLANGEQKVEVAFPAFSGPGQKFPIARIYRDLEMHNLTDPSYPKITQTPITDVMLDHFEPQPIPTIQGRPELVITLTEDGKPIAGAIVLLAPAENQGSMPIGVVTDANGRAWMVTPEGGAYTAWIAITPDRIYRATVQPQRVKEFGVVKQVIVDVSNSGVQE